MEENMTPEITPADEKEASKAPPKRSRRSGRTDGRIDDDNTRTLKAKENLDQAEMVHDIHTEEVDADDVAKPSGSKKSGRRGKAMELELEKQKELAEDATQKYQRLLAEFENARQREAKEAGRMYDVGAKEVLEKLLPVVDNFERAMASIPPEDMDRPFENGVDRIYKQLMDTLNNIGVTPMDAVGKPFDPNLHNAVIHVDDESLGENVVAEEMQKGYMYKESVLRHSMVKVAN